VLVLAAGAELLLSSTGRLLGRALRGARASAAGVEDAVAAADPAVAVHDVARAERQGLARQREGGEDAAADARLAS
jgi:hypothetical protein